jgi:hypothetical protein
MEVVDKKLELDLINQGLICPYCGGETEYVDSSEVGPKSYGMIYLCRPCDARVGVHKGTNKALGRLADERLRYWKKQAHYFFDKIARTSYINEVWEEKLDVNDRNKAYIWLSKQMGIERHQCHIGMFDVDECRKVIEICTPYLESIQVSHPIAKKMEAEKASQVEWIKEKRNVVNAKMVDKREAAFNLIKKFATDNDLGIKILQPGQIRLFKNQVIVDFYTTNSKWHDLIENTRGEYQNLTRFLEKRFVHSK